MADETFRPRHPNETAGVQDNATTPSVEAVPISGDQPAPQVPSEKRQPPQNPGFAIQGKVPPEFLAALNQQRGEPASQQPKKGLSQMGQPAERAGNTQSISSSSGHLKELLEGLRGSNTVYEEVELPSKGRFYNGEDGPANGVLSIRPMTGEEEQILATPRFVRKGQAINMIFKKCIKEDYRPEQLLTIDRTYLLIYLRGISYSPNYDVEMKCPECEKKFGTTLDLNSLFVEECPDNYGPTLEDVLPTTKLPFSYRLSTGRDEQDLNEHRDRRIKAFGDAAADDTLTYRTAQLLNHIDGIESKTELQILLKNLPINDVSYIRNCSNDPPFGVDTNIEIICPSCLQDFQVDLPLDANFFFPRRKKVKNQA